jgi:ribosomal protein S18 acetylase RimI-like enzyme
MKPVRDDVRVSSTTVSVRAATIADLPDAAQIIADHRGEKSNDWVERFRLDLADVDRHFLVATIGDEVVGFGQARVIEGALDSTDSPPAGWYLSGMTVRASARRQGIGGSLIEARLQLLGQRTSTVHYLADPANLATISLHAKFGFTMTHRVALESEDVQLDHYQLDIASPQTP